MFISTILECYKYAALATALYVRMGASQLTGADLAREANAQEEGRLPSVLGEKISLRTETNPDVWNIVRYYGADMPAILDPVAAQDTSGFAATLFEKMGLSIYWSAER